MTAKKRGTLIVMSALSGAGKSTLQKRVLPLFPNLGYSISATTRSPRPGEIDGEHYHFLTAEQFRQMIEQNQLVEWMEVHGNYYGTPRPFLEKQLNNGRDLLLDLDVKGKLNFDKVYPEAVGIFVMVPDLQTLEQRLRDRQSDSEESIALRLHNAREELQIGQEQGKYEYWLVNDQLERATQELIQIIARATGRTPHQP